MNKAELSSTIEEYLQTISHLEKKYRVARVKDIAEKMDVQMPSVTRALKVLKQNKLVNYRRNTFITLTNEGLDLAETINLKHESLTKFLNNLLLVPLEKAKKEACLIKHDVSDDTINRLTRLMKYVCGNIEKLERKKQGSWKAYISGKQKQIQHI